AVTASKRREERVLGKVAGADKSNAEGRAVSPENLAVFREIYTRRRQFFAGLGGRLFIFKKDFQGFFLRFSHADVVRFEGIFNRKYLRDHLLEINLFGRNQL